MELSRGLLRDTRKREREKERESKRERGRERRGNRGREREGEGERGERCISELSYDDYVSFVPFFTNTPTFLNTFICFIYDSFSG